jgi:hypothetical protein
VFVEVLLYDLVSHVTIVVPPLNFSAQFGRCAVASAGSGVVINTIQVLVKGLSLRVCWAAGKYFIPSSSFSSFRGHSSYKVGLVVSGFCVFREGLGSMYPKLLLSNAVQRLLFPLARERLMMQVITTM